MDRTSPFLPLATLAAALLAGEARGEGPARADLVIRNARVVTLDRASKIAGAVAIRGDRIVAVGGEAEVGALAGPGTETLDAGGKVLLPGLYDSHVHPLGASTSEKDHAIPAFASLEDVKAYVAARTKAQPAGTWIVVRYAFPTRFREGRLPTRAELDAIAPDHPVLHQAGPAGVANSKALEVSAITSETPDPPAGQVVKDPRTGEPTGLLRNAYSLLKGLPADAYGGEADPDEGRLKDLFRKYNARGLTSVADRAAGDPALALYRRLRDRGELTVRVNATRVLSRVAGDRAAIIKAMNGLAAYDEGGEPSGPTGVGDRWVRIGPLKVFLDGGMLNGTAYMRTPWGVGPTYQITEPEYRGLLFVEPEPLAVIAEEAARRGWQMTAHVAGEAAMDVLLDAYGHADRVVGIRGRRWLITHANFTSADNLRRCAELGVGADLQPAWLWKDARTLREVLGDGRMAWFHPYRKWLDAGLVIGGGSDHMIRTDPIGATNPWDPWLGLWVAVTRRTEGGGVLNADQRLTRVEALRFYTIDNARLHHEEDDKGTVEPGKLADLILVDRDPLSCPDDELRGTQVLWTMVGGKVVYRAPGGADGVAPASRAGPPSRTEEVRFRSGKDLLAGTLVLPGTPGPHPALALVSGSGSSDRTYHGVAPYLWEHFAHRGVACLAWDRPGVGRSTGDFAAQTFRDRADEVLAAVRFLRDRPEVRRDRVGIWGHSQGGAVAPLAASLSDDVAFVIEVGGSQVVAWQQDSGRVEAQLRADGFPESDVAEAVAFATKRMALIRGKGDFDELEAEHARVEGRPWFPYAGRCDRALFESARRMVEFDPGPAWEGVHCPVLAIYGEKDTSLPPARSLPIIRRGLGRAGNRDLTVRVFPKADHGLIRAETGGPEEGRRRSRARRPGDPPDFAPGYLDLMTDWIAAHAGDGR